MHLGSILCEASKEEEYSELESQVKFWRGVRRPPQSCLLLNHRTNYLSPRGFNHQQDLIGSSGLPIPHQASMCRRKQNGSTWPVVAWHLDPPTGRATGARTGENKKLHLSETAVKCWKQGASGVENIVQSFEHLQNLTWKDGFCDLLMCSPIFKCARTAGCFQWASGGCGWFMESHRNPDLVCCQEM